MQYRLKLVLCMLALRAHGEFCLPDNDEIARVCAPTNDMVYIQNFIYPVLTNIWFNKEGYTKQEINRVQASVYTNLMQYTKSGSLTDSDSCVGNSEHRHLMGCVFGFDCVRDSDKAINEIADYIGAVKGMSDRDYLDRMYHAIALDANISINGVTNYIRNVGWSVVNTGLCLKAAQNEWYPIYKARDRINKYRRRMLYDIKRKIIRYRMKNTPSNDYFAFRSNIVERAKLSQKEESELFEE